MSVLSGVSMGSYTMKCQYYVQPISSCLFATSKTIGAISTSFPVSSLLSSLYLSSQQRPQPRPVVVTAAMDLLSS